MSKISSVIRNLLPVRYCGAVIVAAGSASRMGGIDKVMAPLNGEPMILRTVRNFETCDAISEIVIVTREDLIVPIGNLCRDMDKVKAVVVGGSSRQESVGLGLNALSSKVKLAAIQDGARPLITWQGHASWLRRKSLHNSTSRTYRSSLRRPECVQHCSPEAARSLSDAKCIRAWKTEASGSLSEHMH